MTGLSMRRSVSSCETHLWLLTACCRVTFLSRVTTASSPVLHPVTERAFVSRRSLPQKLLFHLFSFTVGLILIVPERKWELTNEASRGTLNPVTKMSNNKKRSPNKSDLKSTKTTLYLKLHWYRKKQHSIIFLSCFCTRLNRVTFFIQNVCLTSNKFSLMQSQEMPDVKTFKVT